MKKIFISHGTTDSQLALTLAEGIEKAFGQKSVWVDFYDLNGGDDLAGVIREAIQEANWFILLASSTSMNSRWVQYEARLATFLSIEQQNYRILTIKLDDCDFPRDLDLELRRRFYIDARNLPPADLVTKTTEALRKGSQLPAQQAEVFVNRGSEMNAIELAVERDKIVHLVGIRGIGKSALVKTLVRRLGRTLIQIDLRSGHDLGLLSRQILEAAGSPQPPKECDHSELANLAISQAKNAVANQATIFLNHAENVMDDEGNFRPFLQSFLSMCAKANFAFPVLVAAHHRTELKPSDSLYSTPVKIDRLADDFMVLAIQKWHQYMRPDNEPPSHASLQDIVGQLSGYPLAAKLIAGYLIYESPHSLKRPSFISRFKLQVAEYIVGSLVEKLSQAERAILQALAVIGAEVDSSTLWQVQQIRDACASADNLQDSLGRLAGMMLVEQTADALRLHPFIASYFVDQAHQKKQYMALAKSLSSVTWAESKRLLQAIEAIPSTSRNPANREYVTLGSRLLRIAVPAHRLLLLTGERARASKIPFQLTGHVREMVFEMYQGTRDYHACLDFADQWLELEPSDHEVRLYKARALRKLKSYGTADKELSKLERAGGPLLKSKALRERGLIADAQGDLTQAIRFLREGQLRRHDGRPLYSQISIDLAARLIASADKRPAKDLDAQENYEEAARLLEEARAFVPRFEQLYLSLYVDALYSSGKLSKDRAIAMLKEGLKINPDDGGLYFRLADILSDEQEGAEAALEYAEEAIGLGHQKAVLTAAKILINLGRAAEARKKLAMFEPQTEREKVIQDVLTARSLRENPEAARNVLKNYRSGTNPFVDYGLIEIEIAAASKALYTQDPSSAKQLTKKAEELLGESSRRYGEKGGFPAFSSLEADIQQLKKSLEGMT